MSFLKSFTISSILSLSIVSIADAYSFDNGSKINGNFKLVHTFSGLDNGYDTNTGSVYYLNLGFLSKNIQGIKFKINGSIVGDTGFTDKDGIITKGAFMGKNNGKDILDTKLQIEEIYFTYKYNKVKFKAGHFKLNTPMTKNTTSTVPNLYEGLIFSTKSFFENSIVMGGYISKMAYGARALSDWSRIGEKSYTAGSVKVYSTQDRQMIPLASDLSMPAVRRGKWISMGEIAGDDENGLVLVGLINKSFKNTTIQAWNYYAKELVNIIYFDFMTKLKNKNQLTTMYGAQFMYQNIDKESGNPTLFGLKGAIGYKNAKMILSYNKSNTDKIFNIWGGDPAYTSSALSKNAYRPDVDAYKVEARYNLPHIDGILPKGVSIMASYATYSKSSLKNTQQDAKEIDTKLKYMPNKDLMFMLVNVQRESEFNGYLGKEKKQNTSKFVIKYRF